ncbi:hypothetical protein BN946_scf184911.g121 [Trametes cinnabarina]|uniref:Cobalamin-independent methionine synthase MetE C-terminal/archaeal domain-containing protein n=1 Tax=Pycnoporus cinnabarinus TaxID=5643 RepID=A0A060SBC0_PYCCI|nr:hypothetical protein BN946_scf184911.g121 [Trametes cinnabarina]
MSTGRTDGKLHPHALHVGSLLRPRELVEKRIAFNNGQCTAEELRKLEDETLPGIVKLQKDAGLGVITDGEIHRDVYTYGIFEGLDGITVIPKRSIYEFMIISTMGVKEWPSVYCNGKIRHTKPIYAQEFLSLKQHVAPEEVPKLKVTICSPIWHHLNHGSEFTYDRSVYQNDGEYFADLVQAFREEIHELYELGCRYVQFDDPGFSFFCSSAMIGVMEAIGVDHAKLLSTYIDVYNAITAKRPADLVFAVHTCRGNMKGMHFAEGGYDRIAQKLFSDLDVEVFYLESMEEIKARVACAVEIVAEGERKRPMDVALKQLSVLVL